MGTPRSAIGWSAVLLLAAQGCAITTVSVSGGDSGVSQDVPTDTSVPDVSEASVSDRPTVDVVSRDLPAVDVPFEDVVSRDVADGGPFCAWPPPATEPACGASVCGDGARDTCERCVRCGPGGGGGGPPPPPVDGGVCCTTLEEACDGADLGGATCLALGYAGGSLGCAPTCVRQTLECDACAPTEGRGSCVTAPLRSVDARDLALATNGDQIALAWIEHGGFAGVALFDDQLRITASVPCAGFPGVRRVAIAPSGSGFVLAAESGGGVAIVTVAPNGAITSGSFLDGASAPILVGGPERDALLVYTEPGPTDAIVAMAARVSVAGALSRTRARLFRAPTEPEYGSAVATADGWLVAMRVDDVEVVRVGLDMAVSASRRPAGANTEYPQLAWDGARAAMTWSDFGTAGVVKIAELTPAGDLAGPARTLSPLEAGPRYYNVAPMARVGGDLAVLAGTHTGLTGHSGRIDLLRENAQPLMRAPSQHPVTRSPEMVASYRVAPLGGSAVVAWIGLGHPRRIGLARLTP